LGLGQAALLEEVVQFLEGVDLWDWHQEVAPSVAHQILDQTFLVGLPWSTEATLKEVMASEGNESLLLLRLPASQAGSDGLGEMVVPDVLGHAAEEGEGFLVAFKEGLLTLVGEGHQEGSFGETETDHQELNLKGTPPHHHQGFTKIQLGVLARLISQGNEEGMDFGSVLADVLSYRGLTPREVVFCDQAMIDPPGGMALLGGTSLVFPKPLVNEVEEGAQLGPGPGLAPGIVGWSRISQGLSYGASVMMPLSGNLPDAFAFDEVGSPNLFPLIHLKHLYLQ
jgi:hypothetical protein